MCHYISLVTNCTDEARLKALLHKHDRKLTPDDNPSIQKLLVKGERQYLTARQCDCGTELGNIPYLTKQPKDIAKLTAAKVRLGWSKTKIERWLKDRKSTKGSVSSEGSGDEFDFWLNLIREVHLLPGATAVGLIVHHYGRSGDETFDATRQNILTRDDVMGAVRNMNQNELIVVYTQKAAMPRA